MAHVYTLLMLRPKDAVHVVDVLIAAVVGFRAPNSNLMLKNSRHTWFCIALVAAVGNIILLRTFTYISAPFTHSFALKNNNKSTRQIVVLYAFWA